jgi:hypothetical protein
VFPFIIVKSVVVVKFCPPRSIPQPAPPFWVKLLAVQVVVGETASVAFPLCLTLGNVLLEGENVWATLPLKSSESLASDVRATLVKLAVAPFVLSMLAEPRFRVLAPVPLTEPIWFTVPVVEKTMLLAVKVISPQLSPLVVTERGLALPEVMVMAGSVCEASGGGVSTCALVPVKVSVPVPIVVVAEPPILKSAEVPLIVITFVVAPKLKFMANVGIKVRLLIITLESSMHPPVAVPSNWASSVAVGGWFSVQFVPVFQDEVVPFQTLVVTKIQLGGPPQLVVRSVLRTALPLAFPECMHECPISQFKALRV